MCVCVCAVAVMNAVRFSFCLTHINQGCVRLLLGAGADHTIGNMVTHTHTHTHMSFCHTLECLFLVCQFVVGDATDAILAEQLHRAA